MAEIDDRLVPEDGLCKFHIAFARMEALEGNGGARFVFAIKSPDDLLPLELPVVVAPRKGQDLSEMMVRAHDGVIDILRQLIYRADLMRRHYEKRLAPCSQ